MGGQFVLQLRKSWKQYNKDLSNIRTVYSISDNELLLLTQVIRLLFILTSTG